jgi:N-acetylmuramoyl-L-alanine amidase
MRWLVLMLWLAAPAAAQTLYVAPSDAGYLNLRDGPGTRYDVVRRMDAGQPVRVLESQGRWARVRLSDGTEGWAALDLLERGAPATGDPLFVTNTDGGFLNLRAGPGTEHRVLQRMFAGDRLEPLGRDGRWVRVRHPSGTEGWAFDGYLRR